jgi:hypothetical protein
MATDRWERADEERWQRHKALDRRAKELETDRRQTWNFAHYQAQRWAQEEEQLRAEHAKLRDNPELRTRAQECRRWLVSEPDGRIRRCGGAVHVTYIRRGSTSRWTRAGTICRHCGHYQPDEPPVHERERLTLRPATPEEVARWRQQLEDAEEQLREEKAQLTAESVAARGGDPEDAEPERATRRPRLRGHALVEHERQVIAQAARDGG